MAIKRTVVNGVVVGTLDENRSQRSRCDFGRGDLPYALVARLQGNRVRLDVSKHDDFAPRQSVTDKERGTLDGSPCRVFPTGTGQRAKRMRGIRRKYAGQRSVSVFLAH